MAIPLPYSYTTSTDIHLSVDPSDLITPKGSLMLPVLLSTSPQVVARKSREIKIKKKDNLPNKIFSKILSCLSKDASTLHASVNKPVHPLDAYASWIFTIIDQQTLEHRQKRNNLDIDTMLSTLLTQYPNGQPTVPKLGNMGLA